MGYARKALVSLDETPYYHLIARCVRRAWLWGFDAYAGKDYSHRKGWILQRLSDLSKVFAVDVCAYAIMSNHYHLVVHVDRDAARAWSAVEVVGRWAQIYDKPLLVERWLSGEATAAERRQAEVIIEQWRQRLIDVSWYMRCLNEHLARRANAEDECTGRFWEGRFRSQALLDQTGLLTAMAYVDLNPIRAGIADTPETSNFTSIQARIAAAAAHSASSSETKTVPLMKFRTREQHATARLPFALKDYIQLVDRTGRILRKRKRGRIDPSMPPILDRLKIDHAAWERMMKPHGNRFGRALGPLSYLRVHAQTFGQSWIAGIEQARQMFRTA